MQYPHWLMVAGAALVAIGFIGLAFHKSNAEPDENNPGSNLANGSGEPCGGRRATLN